VNAESKPIAFRADAAQPYDDRCLSWQPGRRTVSIWTVAGRLGMRFGCSATQLARLRDHRQGESDLVHRDGNWYLYATCDVPAAELTEPDGFLGVDLGIVNIATTGDGRRHSGKYLNRQRHRARHLRARLQAKSNQVRKTAPQAPAGHAALLGVRPARPVHRLQGGPGRGRGGARRPGVHLPDVLTVRAHQ
jgi:hypothetical protein